MNKILSLERSKLTQFRNPAFYGKIIWKIVRFCMFVGLSFLILYPFIVKLSSCFMSYEDLINPTVNLFPLDGSLTYLRQAMSILDYWNTLGPTAFLAAVVGLAQVLVSSITGYGMARFRFRGRNVLFILVLLTLLVPPQVLMIPLYVRFANFSFFGLGGINLLDSYWPFILLTLTGQDLKSGLYIYLMRQYFQGLPVELEESAYIDGAGPYRTFVSIMWPNARNMILTVFIFSFSWQWTDSNITPMYLRDVNVFSTMVKALTESNLKNPVEVSAINNVAMLLMVLPLLLLFIVLQRYIVKGVESSGIVG